MSHRIRKTETFGEMLKRLRVEEAHIGLRAFADMVNMRPSNLSNMERGRIPPPADRKKLDLICDALGLPRQDPSRERLFDLAAQARNRVPADVADAIREQAGIPVLVRTVSNRQLNEKQIRDLAGYIEKFY